MAGMTSDLEILKDIPGYKAILKSVLKSQIQLLIEQLSNHTGEETIILTASVHDGTLSHLGSNTGKGFLDGRDEIKSQFLAFCLKSHHRRKSSDARSSPYQRPQSGGQGDRLTPSQGLSHKRPRLQPVSLQRAGTGETSGNSFTPPDIHRAPSQNFNTNGQDNSSGVNVKLETSEQSGSNTDNANFATASVSFPTSLQLSHTQTSAEQGTSDTSENQNDDDFTEQTSENDETTATSIKIEPITENEMELEITGVEPGKNSVADSWGQGQVPGTSGVGEGASNETGDQSGYNDAQDLDAAADDGPIEINIEDIHGIDNDIEEPELENNVERRKQKSHGKIYACDECDFWSRHNCSLTRHKRIHSGTNKKAKCDQCDMGFRAKCELTDHMNLVHGEGLLCPYCAKRFTTRSGYSSHVAIEEGRYRYQCDDCKPTKYFMSKTHHDSHMTNHTKFKPFKCIGCEKRYSTNGRCRDHQEKCLMKSLGKDNIPDQFRVKRKKADPTPAKPTYRCKICFAVFAWSQSYYRHVKTQHKHKSEPKQKDS